jgi:hypothetical protein
MHKWKIKINQLLEAIATKDDITGWCLYSCIHDDGSGIFMESCIYWYSNARFEFLRTTSTSKLKEENQGESEGIYELDVVSSSIVAEEKYLIKRILVFLDPTDYEVTYHPQPEDEDSGMEQIIKDEVREAMSDFEEDEDDEDEETSEIGGI